MKRKWYRYFAGLFLIFSVFLSCCAPGETEESAEDGEDTVNIGFCMDSYVIERWYTDRDVFVSSAKESGAEVNVQSANGEAEEQIDQIRYLIKKGVDVLVIIPVDCAALKNVVAEAKNAGIRVVSYDRLIQNADVDLYISFDNEAVGRIMGEELSAALPENAEIAMICGPETDTNVADVEKGFLGAIGGRLQVVYQERCEGWNAAEAKRHIEEALEQHPGISGVMCGNDDVATQVFQVLSEQRLAGKVQLTGQDGDLMALQRVASETQLVSVYKPVAEEAKKAAEAAVALAKGEALQDADTIDNGSFRVPYIELQPVGITKENLDEVIIESGIRSRSEIYINEEAD